MGGTIEYRVSNSLWTDDALAAGIADRPPMLIGGRRPLSSEWRPPLDHKR